MEFANNPLTQPSSLITNLSLGEQSPPTENEDNSQVTLTYQDNSSYKGGWQNGKKHGSVTR